MRLPLAPGGLHAPSCVRRLHVEIVVFGGGYGSAAAFGEQIAAEEWFEVAVEHLVYVAYFDLGAVVLGDAVGLQDVGSDLRTEVDFELRIFKLLADGALFFELIFVEPRTEHLHGLVAIFMLEALVLTLHYDAGGEVSHT